MNSTFGRNIYSQFTPFCHDFLVNLILWLVDDIIPCESNGYNKINRFRLPWRLSAHWLHIRFRSTRRVYVFMGNTRIILYSCKVFHPPLLRVETLYLLPTSVQLGAARVQGFRRGWGGFSKTLWELCRTMTPYHMLLKWELLQAGRWIEKWSAKL